VPVIDVPGIVRAVVMTEFDADLATELHVECRTWSWNNVVSVTAMTQLGAILGDASQRVVDVPIELTNQATRLTHLLMRAVAK